MANKKGQIAVWVIVALIVIVSIIILFVFQKRIVLEKQDQFSPENYMQECIRENIDSAVNQMLPQGGFIQPENPHEYYDKKIEYLCYNQGNYGPCIMQHPALLTEMERQINSYVGLRVISCFDLLKTELEKRNSVVNYGSMELNSTIMPGKVVVEVNRSISVEREDGAESFSSFSIETRSNIYDLARVAIEIGNQEAQYCYFDYLGYMILYHNINITKDVLSEDTKIYTINHRDSDETFSTAIRGCAIPAGLG